MNTDMSPTIEYIDVEHKNPYDHTKVAFIAKGDSKEIIKWCRKNFGQRGDGWDFVGGVKHVQIIIWSSRLLVMWELWRQ